MSDKELLRLAATTHGGVVYVEDMGWIHENPDGSRGSWWNPLENDGDALRLAAKLMEFNPYKQKGYLPCICTDIERTRKTIVVAAAQIGKDLTKV
jgi:hypothetical protein